MSEAYKDSGVNLNAGYEVVSRIKPMVASTFRKGCMGNIGGFGSLFDLGELNYTNPVLVSGTDGVGTKLKIAFALHRHDTVGIDVVAMCVNDILAQGAEPLFFLDYVAVGKNNPETVAQIVSGVAEGCRQAGCALSGGETAEMPGLYSDGEYDLAGFSVGVVEKKEIISGEGIEPGDVIIALPSSGVHSNGFSLVRKIISDKNLDLNKIYPDLDSEQSLGEILLTPTKIYVKPVLALIKEVKVKGIAHITGGGFFENIPRILPDGLAAIINLKTYSVPPIFRFLKKHSGIPAEEMYNVFNMGVGMILVVNPEAKEKALNILERQGLKPFVLGEVKDAEEGQRVILEGLEN